MKGKQLITFIVAFIIGQWACGQDLVTYLHEAASNNPMLKAKYAEFELAMQKTAQVNALPDPNLTFGVFIAPVETRVGPQQAKIGLSQMFPWFGTLAAKGEVSSLMAQARYQEFLNARNALYYDVKTSWYPIYEVQQAINLRNSNLSILTTYKELATIAFQNGKGTMTDVIRVDIMIESENTEIQLLKDKLIPLSVHFNRLLNRDDTTTIHITDSLFMAPLPYYYRQDSLLINNPMLEAYALRLRSAQASEEVARKQGYPGIGIGVDYLMIGKRDGVTVDNNGKDAIMPMVNISIPVYRKKIRAAENEARFLQDAIELSAESYGNQLVSSYELAWYELERAQQHLEMYQRQMEHTSRAIALLLSSYRNSGSEFVEILRMQQELIKYQLAQARAITDYFSALARIDYLTSKSE